MEIQPGVGVEHVRLGESRHVVDARLGEPRAPDGDRVLYDHQAPPIIVSYDAKGAVELIEVPHAGTVEHEATLGGIQLTGRALDDVRAALEDAGHTGRTSDIGYDFDTGFSIFSMGSIMVAEVDPSAAQDDERLVVEGVAVADPAYFGF